MRFSVPLVPGVLVRRRQRFLADVRLSAESAGAARVVAVHCPNSGSMRACAEPGWQVLLSSSRNPGRRTRFTWELVHNGRCWIGVNTLLTNRVAEEALAAGRIPELAGYSRIRREVRWGEHTRFDFFLDGAEDRPAMFLEVKSVTLVCGDGCYCFPDAPTVRGRKHLAGLIEVVRSGRRAGMLFVIQRSDGNGFRPAREIDPEYAEGLAAAAAAGVEILAWRARVTPEEIVLEAPEAVLLG